MPDDQIINLTRGEPLDFMKLLMLIIGGAALAFGHDGNHAEAIFCGTVALACFAIVTIVETRHRRAQRASNVVILSKPADSSAATAGIHNGSEE